MIQGLIAVVLTAAFAPAARAATEPVFRYMPEPAFETIVARGIEPMQAKDAFAGLAECSVVDARTFAPVPTAQAEKMLAPCLGAVGRRYNQPLRLERMSAAPQGSMSAQIEGLAIWVPEETAITSPIMRDLEHSLSARQGRILGHPVVIRRGAQPSDNKPVLSPDAMTRSALQVTIDGCLMTQVVRRIETSEDFIASYGRCIVNDKKLLISEVRPAVGHSLGITVQSQADATTVRSLNGQIRVAGAEGPVTVSVVAYASTIALP